MYYYGYGGYGYNNPCMQSYPVYPSYCYGNNQGYGGAIILVLFILLVIVIGSRFLNNN